MENKILKRKSGAMFLKIAFNDETVLHVKSFRDDLIDKSLQCWFIVGPASQTVTSVKLTLVERLLLLLFFPLV